MTETDKGTGSVNGMPQNEDKLIEYTETVLEVPEGATKATKLARTYKKATKLDPGTNKQKSMPLEGKTVTIEKKGPRYAFTANGKPLPAANAMELDREFNKNPDDDDKLELLLPKGAVKVGETWTPGADAVKKLFAGMPFPIDDSKTKLTGKLSKAYTQDGKQWGTLVFDVDLAIDTAAGGKGAPKAPGGLTGTIKAAITFGAPLDGSAPDGTMKMVLKMDLGSQGGGPNLKITAENTRMKTVRSVK